MRRVLFLFSVIFIITSLGIIVFAFITFFMDTRDWLFPLILLGIGLGSGTVSVILYLVRKSRFPVPGIDYK